MVLNDRARSSTASVALRAAMGQLFVQSSDGLGVHEHRFTDEFVNLVI